MWSIFHCLALGTLVMSHGNEDYLLPKWNKEIVHFDIKQENCQLESHPPPPPPKNINTQVLIGVVVLIGSPMTNAEHLGNTPLKVPEIWKYVDINTLRRTYH